MAEMMIGRNPHSLGRPLGFYDPLKEQAKIGRPDAVLLRYATKPKMVLQVEIPKPRLKELTEARREQTARVTGKQPAPTIAPRPSGARPAYSKWRSFPSPAPC
jgi:hypothetical protein